MTNILSPDINDIGFTINTGAAHGDNYLRKNKLTNKVKIHFALQNMNTALTSINKAFAVINEKYRPKKSIYVMGIGYDDKGAYSPVLVEINSNGNVCQVFSSSTTYTRIYFDAWWLTI